MRPWGLFALAVFNAINVGVGIGLLSLGNPAGALGAIAGLVGAVASFRALMRCGQ